MSTGASGTISIITPFFDAEHFLAETIESVLAQDREGWELILVDDGSTDASRETAETYAAAHPARISVYDHENRANLGTSASRRLGWRRSSGAYILFLDADDLLLPHALSTLAGALDRNPTAGLVQAGTVYWHSWQPGAEAEDDYVPTLPFPIDRLIAPPALAEGPLIGSFVWPCTMAILFRRTMCPPDGPYDVRFPHLFDDLVAYVRVVLASPAYVSGEIVSLYRQRLGSVTSASSDDDQLEWRHLVLERIGQEIEAGMTNAPVVRRWLAQARFLMAHPGVARLRRMIMKIGRVARGLPKELVQPTPAHLHAFIDAHRRTLDPPDGGSTATPHPDAVP